MSLNYNVSLNLQERCADPVCLISSTHIHKATDTKKKEKKKVLQVLVVLEAVLRCEMGLLAENVK